MNSKGFRMIHRAIGSRACLPIVLLGLCAIGTPASTHASPVLQGGAFQIPDVSGTAYVDMHYVGQTRAMVRLGMVAVHLRTDSSARPVLPAFTQILVEPYVWIPDQSGTIQYFDRFFVGDTGIGKRRTEKCKWFDIWYGRWHLEGKSGPQNLSGTQTCGHNKECFGDYHGATTLPCFVQGSTQSCENALVHGERRFTITIPRHGGEYCMAEPDFSPNGYTEVTIRFAEAFDNNNDYREVFLRTQQAPQFTKGLSVRSVMNTNGAWETRTFDFSGNPLLRGTITQIRFDPADSTPGDCGIPVGCIHIDWLKIRNPSTNDEQVWNWNSAGNTEGWVQDGFYPSTPGFPEAGKWLMMPNMHDPQLLGPDISKGP